jgi:predicted amidohydrolase
MNRALPLSGATPPPHPPAGPRTLRVAAIQTPAADDVLSGLQRATPLVKRAVAEGAELVLLPELMAVRYVFTEEMWDSAEPAHGPTLEWLKDVARTLGIWVGTSFLEAAGQDFYNTWSDPRVTRRAASASRPQPCTSRGSSVARRDRT